MMRYMQNPLFTLSILVLLVHYLISGYEANATASYSDHLVIHVSPDYSSEDVLKPANSLSLLEGKFQVDWVLSLTSHVDSDRLTWEKCPLKFLFFSKTFVPIFLSNCVIRI
jgi:hypothetical protein